jgi:acyl-CoA synthetase (AMP-forming)/AMP-acid ligase II
MTSHRLTTPAVLDRMALDFADHQALVTAQRSFTFSELRDEVRRAAAAIAGLGVDAHDRVAIWSPNTWHWVVACLATHYAGAVVVPLNTRYTAGEATDILARTKAPLLIGMGRFLGADRVGDLDPRALPALRHIVRVPVEDGDADAAASWGGFMSGPQLPLSEIDARAHAVSPDDVSDILFTSGTTGRSKGVLCAHRQSLSAPAAWAECGELSSSDRYLCINPFFHNFGYKAGILACLQTGATLIPQLTFEPEQAMRAVQDHQITVLPGPPTIYQTLLDHPSRKDFDLSSLRFAVTGAATIPVVLIERMQSELDFDIVLTAYGLTEASGFGTMCQPDDDPVTVATTCGRPIAEFELRIAPPEEADDDSGAGEVLLRGPNVMLGYLDDPAATAAAIDADGWLHTGDVGTVDESGNLRITDRLKDMYICGGFNVYPAEVEQALARLEGVADVAVIGVPDDRLGEVGRAFIVRRPAAELDDNSVIEFTRKHLANFKVPRSVVFVEELPRNAGGKVVKPTLREMT